MPKLGAMELGIILLIILMVFGVGKLPQVGSSLGKAIRSFKDGASGGDETKAKEEPEAVEKPKRRVAKKAARGTSVDAEKGKSGRDV